MTEITFNTPCCVNTCPTKLRVRQTKEVYPLDDTFTDTVPNALQVMPTEDTADTDELRALAPESARQIRKYARGFLRFYRARRILSGNRNINTVTRERALYAWQYLATLEPNELPPALRKAYREIVALADSLDRANESQSPVKFVSKILKITLSIDEAVDDLLTDTEKPKELDEDPSSSSRQCVVATEQ